MLSTQNATQTDDRADSDCILVFNPNSEKKANHIHTIDVKNHHVTYKIYLVDLGCPKELQFGGSSTLEAWVRFVNCDGSYLTCFYVQHNNLCCGYAGMIGSTSGHASTKCELTQWTHIACIYDAPDAM